MQVIGILSTKKNNLTLYHHSSLDLCRRFKALANQGGGNAIAELRNMQENRPQQMMTFIRTLSELEELTLKRLTTTVE